MTNRGRKAASSYNQVYHKKTSLSEEVWYLKESEVFFLSKDAE